MSDVSLGTRMGDNLVVDKDVSTKKLFIESRQPLEL